MAVTMASSSIVFATRAGGDHHLTEALDPIVDSLNLFLCRLPIAIELLEAVVGHLLLGNLDEQLGAVRIARQDQSGDLSNLFEVQDVAEILGRLLAL